MVVWTEPIFKQSIYWWPPVVPKANTKWKLQKLTCGRNLILADFVINTLYGLSYVVMATALLGSYYYRKNKMNWLTEGTQVRLGSELSYAWFKGQGPNSYYVVLQLKGWPACFLCWLNHCFKILLKEYLNIWT